MHELGVLDPVGAHVTRDTRRHEPADAIGAVSKVLGVFMFYLKSKLPFWVFVLNASGIKADKCYDNGDNERLDGALLHEADQRPNDEKGRVGLDDRGNGHLRG